MVSGKGPFRRLTIKAFHVEQAGFGEETLFENAKLSLGRQEPARAAAAESLVQSFEVDILPPGGLRREVFTILDIIPVATKVLGRIGEGITHLLTGVVAVLTAVDAGGRPLATFGSSAGVLEDRLFFGRPGTPAPGDRVILCQVVLKEGAGFNREGIFAAHRTADRLIQSIRDSLKKVNGDAFTEKRVFEEGAGQGKKKVVLVKLLAGQGAMHDNLVFPLEPGGMKGGRSIIDIGNMPLVLSPNEYRDGAIKALT